MQIVQKSLNRIFRVGTPHDIFCAVIVARKLPKGNDVLFINSNYDDGAPEYMECMRMATTNHKWQSVIDGSELLINQFHKSAKTIVERASEIIEFPKSIKQLRRYFAALYGISSDSNELEFEIDSAVDEIYLNCLHHYEVQALYKIFPSPKKIYYPHGFDSLHSAEIAYYDKYLNPSPLNLKSKLINTAKKYLLEDDAIPIKKVWLDAAYSFNRLFPNLEEQQLIKDELNLETMKILFDGLAPEAKNYFTELASRCQGNVALLLLFVEDQHADYPQQLELDSYVKLVREMIKREAAETILIKPHPLMSKTWLNRILSHLVEFLPDIKIVIIENYRYLSIEIVLSAFNPVACTGVASSSMRTLKEIYGLETYYSKELLLKLYETHPVHQVSSRQWLEEVEGLFVAVNI